MRFPGGINAWRGAATCVRAEFLPWSVISRPLDGDVPTIDLVIGYSNSNTSPILKLFLSGRTI